MTISNWNGSARFTPAAVVAPTNVGELIAVVTNRELPSPLRAVGELHSLNDSVTTAGTVVFMKHFASIGEPLGPPGKQRVTVGAGVRMIDLKNALRKNRLQLEVVPEIGNATAGSVACCGTKDSSLGPAGPGQISSTVRAVRMVTATGQDVAVPEGDPRLPLIRSSYGLLGIIYEVTFEVQPRKKVKYQYVWVDLDRWLKTGEPLPEPDGPDILGRADGFLGFMLPYRRQLLVERRKVARRHFRLWGLDRVKLWLRTLAWTCGARPFMRPMRLLPKPARHRMTAAWIGLLERGFLRLFFLRLLCSFASFRADAMIDFKRPVSSYFDFTFWAFPAREWDRTVRDFLKFCEEFHRRTGFRPGLPAEVYFIRKDDLGLLSFCPDGDIFTLDLVNWTDAEPACWREMNREFNEFAARHRGRPLLNQTKELSRAVAMHVWTLGWHTLAEARRTADPDERFLTPFFKEILPAPRG
jgi:hypothetical protein